MPQGADCSQRDSYVRHGVQEELKRIPKDGRDAPPKLKSALARVLSEMRADASLVKRAEKACNISGPKRLFWDTRNGGQLSIGNPRRAKK